MWRKGTGEEGSRAVLQAPPPMRSTALGSFTGLGRALLRNQIFRPQLQKTHPRHGRLHVRHVAVKALD